MFYIIKEIAYIVGTGLALALLFAWPLIVA
jgi:hypothetical protein